MPFRLQSTREAAPRHAAAPPIAGGGDGSALHQHEESLRVAREHFEALVAASPAAIISLDSDGRITTWSKGAEDLYGWSASEVVGGPLPLPDFDGEVRALRSALLKGTAVQGVELTHSRKDGRPIDVSLSAAPLRAADGTPSGMMAVVTDVSARSEQVATLERLRRSEEQYRKLVENLDDIVYTVDAEGRITYVSGAVARYGYVPAELIGRRFLDFTHPDDRLWVEQAFAARLAADLEPIEYRVLDREGRVRVVRSSSRRSLEDGGTTGLLGVLFDLTAQRQTEEALRGAQKMEAVGRLAGGVAHDFNNILTVISSYAGLSQRGLAADDPLRSDLEEIRKASDRATGLTRQLLAFSRRQVLQPTIIDLNSLVAGIEKMLGRLIGEDVDLRFSAAPDLGRISADPGQIEQVLMNLAVNARDAMPAGGTLTITTGNAELDEDFALSHAGGRVGPHVVLTVQDTGSGMDPATLDRIFEPFFTTKPIGKGTGLGLATVYGIVKQSGGGIWVESAPGEGATFRVYLPRVEDQAVVPPPAQRPERPRGGSATILLVEDDAAVRQLSLRVLSLEGHRVLVAANGSEALLLCERHRAEISLIVTDVIMPGMSGRELATRIAAFAPNARILFMSGYTDDAIAHHGVLEPGTLLLSKPFTPEVLADRVRDALAGQG